MMFTELLAPKFKSLSVDITICIIFDEKFQHINFGLLIQFFSNYGKVARQ